jgi:hypothetical protein
LTLSGYLTQWKPSEMWLTILQTACSFRCCFNCQDLCMDTSLKSRETCWQWYSFFNIWVID